MTEPTDETDDGPLTQSIRLEISNTDEFREALNDLADHVQTVREEVQALNEELERAEELADGAPYVRQKYGNCEVALFGDGSAELLDK